MSWSASNEREDESEEREQWENLQIDFEPIGRSFPDNKIYAFIRVKPESDRKLIKNFAVFINNYPRGNFQSSYRSISIGGFDTTNTSNVKIQIRANAVNTNWKMINKESESFDISFTEVITNPSPVISFEWPDENSEVVTVIKWQPIEDQAVQRYVVTLDKEVIYCLDRQSLAESFSVQLSSLRSGKKYILQIICKLKNGKEKYHSDNIPFTVPSQQNEMNAEIITIRKESVPDEIWSLIEPVDRRDKQKEVLTTTSNRNLNNALELLKKLQEQIERKRPH